MRTTIDLPEEVLHRAEERAATLGVDVNQFIAIAIAKEIDAAGTTTPVPVVSKARSKLPMIRSQAKGTIPSLTPDLQARLQEEADVAEY